MWVSSMWLIGFGPFLYESVNFQVFFFLKKNQKLCVSVFSHIWGLCKKKKKYFTEKKKSNNLRKIIKFISRDNGMRPHMTPEASRS